jgi:hypothetical protein
VPRIYQVTPDIPDRRRATQKNGSQALAQPTASKRVSSPPVGTIPTASDDTDAPITTASLDAAALEAGWVAAYAAVTRGNGKRIPPLSLVVQKTVVNRSARSRATLGSRWAARDERGG